MSSHISSLPDLGLLKMFEKLDLIDLHRAGQVCPRWRSLRSVAYTERRSLYICLCTLENIFTFYKNKLCIADFNTDNIINQFPNVRVLSLRLPHFIEDQRENIIRLAELFNNPKWKKLVSLKLFAFWWRSDITDETILGLVLSINSLSALKHLELEGLFVFSLLPRLTILPQLKSLTIEQFGMLDDQLDDLVNFMVGLDPKQLTSLKSITLNVGINSVFERRVKTEQVLEKLLKMRPKIAQKVTSLCFLGDVGFYEPLFPRYLGFFPSLREATFGLDFKGSWFPALFNTMAAKLVELRELKIALQNEDFPTDSNVLQLTPMPTLEKFSVLLAPHWMGQIPLHVFTRLSVSLTFPNISQLVIENYHKSSCNVCGAEFAKLSKVQMQVCIHHLIEPFKGCQRLKKIKLVFIDSLYEYVMQVPFDEIEAIAIEAPW